MYNFRVNFYQIMERGAQLSNKVKVTKYRAPRVRAGTSGRLSGWPSFNLHPSQRIFWLFSFPSFLQPPNKLAWSAETHNRKQTRKMCEKVHSFHSSYNFIQK